MRGRRSPSCSRSPGSRCCSWWRSADARWPRCSAAHAHGRLGDAVYQFDGSNLVLVIGGAARDGRRCRWRCGRWTTGRASRSSRRPDRGGARRAARARAAEQARGLFVAFEGGEGVGQVHPGAAARHLAARPGLRRRADPRARLDQGRHAAARDPARPRPPGLSRARRGAAVRRRQGRARREGHPAGPRPRRRWWSPTATSTRRWPTRAPGGRSTRRTWRRVNAWATGGLRAATSPC